MSFFLSLLDLEIIMSFRLYYFLLLLLLSSEGRERKILDDYLNTCLDGKNHKLRPGPEGTLFQKVFI